MPVKIHSAETFECVSHMLPSLQLHGYCMLVNLRDDILNTIPNCHIITVQSMSIMKSISITIQFDTLVFLNLGNKLFTGAKWQLRNATESGWTMCTSHLFLGFMKIILTDNKCTFRHFQFIMSSIGSRLL